MANLTRNFLAGRMNKVYDQRVVPNGEYIDAMNVRMGSTENSEIGVIENSKGNTALTALAFIDGTSLSTDALCIGAIADSANETIYWFVHDSNFPDAPSGKLDMIVSKNILTGILTYHIISTDDGTGLATTLNFNPKYLITGVDMIENLIFFTDDYNPPRFFNVKPLTNRYPNPIAYIDQFSAECLLVVKKPPIASPASQPIITGGQQNYMDTRFICFAYRYRYVDGEYSATSQWSAPAFIPQTFQFSINSFLNEGMVNLCNAAQITYNAGGPLVVGVDLLFKQANNNIIKIIEKLDKKQLGLNDNTDYNYIFNNSKIFTILIESELLRLFDNVPRFAKAQTIMGNRLMYGNYVEGYDLVDSLGRMVNLNYSTSLVTEIIGDTVLNDSTSSGNPYTIDGSVVVPNSVVNVDFTTVEPNLKNGASFSLDIKVSHYSFTGSVVPTETASDVSVVFLFTLSQDYTSVYQMAISPEFQDAIGTLANILPVYDPAGITNPCNGFTFTDKLNCALPQNLTYSGGSLEKFASGISGNGQPIKIITSPASKIIGFQMIAMQYVDNLVTPVDYAYEYYNVTTASATFQEIASPRSLHSNRGYEIGIVYMDEFNRSSTALVSLSNTQYIPCSNSDTKNSIYVNIPTTQIAPYWAKRYKFVIKPDQENYETIYTSIFFLSPTDNTVYFLLEGENTRKVEQGDRFVVKRDSNGPTQSCVYATVLEKEAKIEGFIVPATGVTPPGGVYMKINPNSFSITADPLAIVAPGTKTVTVTGDGTVPVMSYDMNTQTTPGVWVDYTVPAGSKISINITTQRQGPGSGNRSCEKRIYIWSQSFTASSNYNNMRDWWDGDSIKNFINNGTSTVGSGATPVSNQYFPSLLSNPNSIPYNFDINSWQWCREANNRLSLCVSAVQSCGSSAGRSSSIILDIQVFRADTIFVFETEPDDALPDVFFENDLSFEVDVDGNHMGNIQNQDIAIGVPAIIDTKFFNCFAFGNGVESYKIRDSITGRSFNLGNRVTTVASQDYKESDRFADMTYSGIYNPETNLNKLNEFNSALLNYKALEISFGEIYKMDGRETDVLVLQEDKISYVLAGKNLLSDSAAGGAITSVPEVLGTQIARTEKYGISFNPESYVQWGYDRFFADAKRGAVIQLQGNSYSNEQLNVISELNMRTWFRDRFNESFSTQKLGGFDPYMNEYVLCLTDRELPSNPSCLACGTSQTFTLSGTANQNYCVNLGALVGPVDVIWNIVSMSGTDEIQITVEYNANIYSSGFTGNSGQFTFNKNLNYVDIAQVQIEHTGNVVLEVIVNCPTPEEMSVFQVVLTNNYDLGKTIHAEYRYSVGTFIGPTQSNFVTFLSGTTNPLVSFYNVISGFAGAGAFPTGGSTVRIQTNSLESDDYVFDPASDKFRYLRTNTVYNNNSIDMSAMIAASSIATPITTSGSIDYAEFITPNSVDGENLYLIWDLRDSVPVQLCYSDDIAGATPSCCNCTGPEPIQATYSCSAIVNGTPKSSYKMERNWFDDQSPFPPLGVYSFELIDLILDGVQFSSGESITISAPDDLVVGPGVSGGIFIQNINDWLNSITGVNDAGFIFHDDMSTIFSPISASTYRVVIQRTTDRTAETFCYRWERLSTGQTGYGIGSTPTTTSICYNGCWECGSVPIPVPPTADELCVIDPGWALYNLNVTNYANGDPIPYVSDPTAWAALTTGAYCCPNDLCENVSNGPNGFLYNWYAVNDVRGLAPTGYHVPTETEWDTLIGCLGGYFVAGGKMKTDQPYTWQTPNTGATNSSLFTALPAGGRNTGGVYYAWGQETSFWASTLDPANPTYPVYYIIGYNSGDITRDYIDKEMGFSVRVLAD